MVEASPPVTILDAYRSRENSVYPGIDGWLALSVFFAGILKKQEIIAPLGKRRGVPILNLVCVDNLCVLPDFLLHGLNCSVLSKKQGFILGITFFRDIDIVRQPIRDGEHIVDIDDGIVFDFDEVHCFRHFRMLGFERRQRCKIIHPVDREDHAYVLSLIGLSGNLVVEQVRGESSEVIHIFGIDFI